MYNNYTSCYLPSVVILIRIGCSVVWFFVALPIFFIHLLILLLFLYLHLLLFLHLLILLFLHMILFLHLLFLFLPSSLPPPAPLPRLFLQFPISPPLPPHILSPVLMYLSRPVPLPPPPPPPCLPNSLPPPPHFHRLPLS